MCGRVVTQATHDVDVVVTGGWDVWDATTEIMTFENGEETENVDLGWRKGARLPLPLREAATVQLKVKMNHQKVSRDYSYFRLMSWWKYQ